jgi:hypothetical protein
MGIYERDGAEGSRMMAGLCGSRSTAIGEEGPRVRQLGGAPAPGRLI